MQVRSLSVAHNMTKVNIEDFTHKDATHLLRCRHCVGTKHCRTYYMDCIVLGETSNGLLKLLVFGERNWKNKEHIKRVRYMPKNKVIKKELTEKSPLKQKLWRTLVRIQNVDENSIHVVIPAWDSVKVVPIKRSILPENINNLVQPMVRVHAEVNIGCENEEDLKFVNWEEK